MLAALHECVHWTQIVGWAVDLVNAMGCNLPGILTVCER